jgi:hypothetical protein
MRKSAAEAHRNVIKNTKNPVQNWDRVLQQLVPFSSLAAISEQIIASGMASDEFPEGDAAL